MQRKHISAFFVGGTIAQRHKSAFFGHKITVKQNSANCPKVPFTGNMIPHSFEEHHQAETGFRNSCKDTIQPEQDSTPSIHAPCCPSGIPDFPWSYHGPGTSIQCLPAGTIRMEHPASRLSSRTPSASWASPNELRIRLSRGLEQAWDIGKLDRNGTPRP